MCVCVCVLLSSIISDISVLKLKVDKCSRQDNLFMKKVLPLQFIIQYYKYLYLSADFCGSVNIVIL